VNKSEVYVEIVGKYFEYHYDMTLGDFVVKVIGHLQRESKHPEECAQLLHQVLVATLHNPHALEK